jgi:CMP-N,N'-diacetyllegionaminic acid synthase
MSILAIVPARAGSKGIPDKNVISFRGKPLLVHSVEQGLAAQNVDRVLVSTDSARYRDIALAAGAEAPFLRPAAFSGDHATDLEVFVHALDWLEAHEGYRPEICVHLRPTYPTRSVADVENAIALLQRDVTADSVRSVTLAPQTPYKMWRLDDRGALHPLLESPLRDPWNLPRQALPPVYLQNAAVDVVRSAVVREQRSMTGRRILAYAMSEVLDIDAWADLAVAEQGFPAGELPRGRTFAFDLDGVLATLVTDHDYEKCEPNRAGIALVNQLHDAGNRIVIYTARGSLTGRDWAHTTQNQLRSWGVRHHELQFGKPAADYYVDDRMVSLATLMAWVDSSSQGDRRQSA